MEKIVVCGGKPLTGRIRVSGAKNAVLPVIAASILGEKGTSVIDDVPALDDVFTIINVLRHLNIQVKYKKGKLYIDATKDLGTEAPYEYVRKMRASVLVMGPLLARTGRAQVALPGGCAIGSRPIDQHLKGFEALGATINIGNGYVEASVDGRLQGKNIYLDIPSVGATENIMMAATLAQGVTVIENAAEEPEIVDLANYLNAMGARIEGAGTGTIRIEGVQSLQGAAHTVIPDRIEAGTYMIAAAITRSKLFIEGAVPRHLNPLISKLADMGAEVTIMDGGIQVDARHKTLTAVDVKTMPHPGFPTDLQPQMMALLLTAKGNSVVTESVFENRFMHVEELKRMNATIKIEGRSAILEGAAKLQGTKVTASDLRAGAALILAGLVAEGETEIFGLHHIDRGYEDIVGKLVACGADIMRFNAAGEEINQPQLAAIKWKAQASYA
ncbi:UDP-N-acetylglucosamine 1-carboxyvinyltransferase [Caldalkalibacillus uzonensis]|uniref:UDP-N-acetylglucosamine 1-carboxyvinyltransferase n=1 Tax=Caldalkalibacillus uzonensis TaxID=353224 RepID=A0ABU0CWL8_9BACI|nr:UDP-N-acetylglucosamine 1-carboxyvinyltransferase [Caldalkalibacillus uzonensis]MDQ0339437.1 UDP-N-acetylglucosamine 1-carboxyvinyltransferase [Caldalkalibacillus uzonensis]